MATFALDTSAISALLRRERNYEIVVSVLDDARTLGGPTVLIPFVALMEIEYAMRRHEDEATVEQWLAWIESWPAEVIESTPAWRRAAARIKLSHHLSLADAWVASLAQLVDAVLIHKDPEFDAVPDLKAQRLAYTPSTRGRRG